jgi:hypothetical protein
LGGSWFFWLDVHRVMDELRMSIVLSKPVWQSE